MSDITNAAVEAATMTEEIEKIEPAAITIDEVETYDLPSTYDDYEGAPPLLPLHRSGSWTTTWPTGRSRRSPRRRPSTTA